jgi:hypothetical protein
MYLHDTAGVWLQSLDFSIEIPAGFPQVFEVVAFVCGPRDVLHDIAEMKA